MNEPLLLDTNILIHLIRGNETGQRVDQQFQLTQRSERPLISVVTVGECLSLAKQFGWGEAKTTKLRDLLRELVVVPINREPIIQRFAEFHSWSKLNGWSIGDNDLWIAATAAETRSELVTCDRDFDPLHPDRVSRTYIESS